MKKRVRMMRQISDFVVRYPLTTTYVLTWMAAFVVVVILL